MVWHQELPVLATGVVSQDAVMRAAMGRVTVLLDGQGADELLGGYLGHAMIHYQALLRAHPARWGAEFPAFALRAWPHYLPGLTLRELVALTGNVLQHGRDARHFLIQSWKPWRANARRSASRTSCPAPGRSTSTSTRP